MKMVSKFFLLALAMACIAVFSSACGGSSGGDDDSQFVGTWALYSGGSVSWYVHFNSDGSWNITDDVNGGNQRVYGTYTVSGNTAHGSMYNPGVGEGEINATINGDTMDFDFVEYWHTPYKHVPYTGVKVN